MKIRILILLSALLFIAGCSSTQTERQNIGRPMAKVGQFTGDVGMGILVTSGVFAPLMPIGIVVGGPILLLGYPFYAGGCWIAGDMIETYPVGY